MVNTVHFLLRSTIFFYNVNVLTDGLGIGYRPYSTGIIWKVNRI